MPPTPFSVPIESMRPGGLPAADVYKPPPGPAEQDESIRDLAAARRARRGRHEDGAPATAAFDSGGNVFYPPSALPRQLPQCDECGGEQYISVEFLAAHRVAAHRAGGSDGE